ncbi:malonyl-CoA O-methyltransferase [Trichlorobacter thiogenes]|uniref:Malonyl-[acyl-carrier protein] O-methyltransferase n=1 Tax=Trichlorobacter thiogenes TaxID=115783 RepID=A0A1T4R9F9_9BACT|nr:malonyl-ACP O-methyltransferase BioC [Trichlorobacter thiogenes]SKA12557.1 malonyl-CoA O-methyltransferase [Trichlorobacter thiogenes]
MTGIDRQRVQSSFHKGAEAYDQHTPVQQRVLQQLMQQIGQYPFAPNAAVLDVGCGTGRLLELLGHCFPDAVLTGLDLAPNMLQQAAVRLGGKARLIQGDAEQLPFADSSFQMVLSSSTFQWLDTLQCCFGEARRVLKPEGRFVFSLFGEGTLYELRESWQQALLNTGRERTEQNNGTHRFYSSDQVQQALELTGFRDVTVWSELEQVWYPDVPHLLQAIKRIGAGTSRPLSGGGLGWRRVLHEMAAIYYERFGTPDGVPVSYSVIYAAGRR